MIPVSISATNNKSNQISKKSINICDSSIPCLKCPAKFNALPSYLQHSNHHGKATNFKCKHCDFGAESMNNLTLHSILHAGSEVTIEPEVFGKELVELMEGNKNSSVSSIRNVGPPTKNVIKPEIVPEEVDFAVVRAYQGNPEFKYPTYVKNGRIKSKRYKCLKCPSAFEKRDQYKVHVGLHGSSQRYRCMVCDYAVTYYANFIQHLKKHENQANVSKEQLVAIPLSKMNKIITSSAQQTASGKINESTKTNKVFFYSN
jgi:hypothetical protein